MHLDLTRLVAPCFAWMRVYSHTDKRHLLTMLHTPVSHSTLLGPPPTKLKSPAFACEIVPLPLAHGHPFYAKHHADYAVIQQRDAPMSVADRPYLGAIWQPHNPTWLRIATRRMIDPSDTEIYATIMAETAKKQAFPLLLRLLDPTILHV